MYINKTILFSAEIWSTWSSSCWTPCWRRKSGRKLVTIVAIVSTTPATLPAVKFWREVSSSCSPTKQMVWRSWLPRWHKPKQWNRQFRDSKRALHFCFLRWNGTRWRSTNWHRSLLIEQFISRCWRWRLFWRCVLLFSRVLCFCFVAKTSPAAATLLIIGVGK